MNDYITASPQHSEVVSDENDVSSNKETALLNSTNSAKNNFKSAYVLQKQIKPIVRGRKTFAFWTLVCLLFLLAVGNLVLTMTILGVLKLGNGMQSIELLANEKAIKLFGDVDLDRIYKQDGLIEGYDGEDLDITGDDSSILINLSRLNRVINKLRIDKNETCFNGFNTFEITNKQKETLFTTNNPMFKNLKNVNNFKTTGMGTNKIRSPIDDNLKIESDNIVHLKGNEGAKLEAREIVWSADQDIYLKSINGSIVLSGKEGTYLDVERIPIAKLDRSNYVTAQFKICVCMPQGKLFRVPVANANDPVYCHQVDMSAQYNPCM